MLRGIVGASVLTAFAALVVGAEVGRCQGAVDPIRCVSTSPLTIEMWHDVVEIPGGSVKYAAWGDLRIEIRVKAGAPVLMHAFAASTDATLPERDADPRKPVLMQDRQAADERKDWISLSDPDCRAVDLAQGEIATQRVIVIGVDANPDKKGGVVLWWRFGLPPKERFPVFEPWAPRDAKIIMADRWRAPDLKPRVIPCASSKKEETFLVLRKGKRIVAVLRHKAPVAGGDPYERALISVDVDAQRAIGSVELSAEASTKAFQKFMADHAPKEFDPRSTSFLLALDTSTWMVMFGTATAGARTWEIFERPGA